MDNKDIAIEKMRNALQAMCDCGASFQGQDQLNIDDFLEKAGPVISNASSVLTEVDELLGDK